jgi:hypothetical protein
MALVKYTHTLTADDARTTPRTDKVDMRFTTVQLQSQSNGLKKTERIQHGTHSSACCVVPPAITALLHQSQREHAHDHSIIVT